MAPFGLSMPLEDRAGIANEGASPQVDPLVSATGEEKGLLGSDYLTSMIG